MIIQFLNQIDPKDNKRLQTVQLNSGSSVRQIPVTDLEGGVRGVRPTPLKFAKHMLYNSSINNFFMNG